MAPNDDEPSAPGWDEDGPAEGVDPYLRRRDVRFGPSDVALLRSVDEQGSLNAATDVLGRSYARSLERLTDLEAAFGPLVSRSRGGADGGGSHLTAGARRLLARFDRFRAAVDGMVAAEESVLPGRVVTRDGQVATVETAAGRLRAHAPDGGEEVDVAVRADAVTLHAPNAVPVPDGTSARNQLSGRVTRVDRGDARIRTVVSLGEATLLAYVTPDSARRLELAPDVAVVATFKATATRAVPRRE